MPRPYYFKLRLDEAERDDLAEKARRAGRSRADVIRQALGWKPERRSRNLDAMAKSIKAGGDAAESADQASEPGKAAIERLAQKIRNREGVTTPVARRQARQRLKGTE